LLVGLAAVAAAPAQQKLPIGVVDLRKVEESMDQTKLKAQESATEEAMKREAERLREEMNRIKRDSETLQPTSVEYLHLIGRFETLKNQVKWTMGEGLDAAINNVRAQFFEERYLLIVKEIERIAEQKGLLLVLRLRGMPSPTVEPRYRFAMLGDRDVLYHHASVDLTEELIKILKVPEAKAPNDQKQPQPAPAADAKTK
jgi:hypothetical protein